MELDHFFSFLEIWVLNDHNKVLRVGVRRGVIIVSCLIIQRCVKLVGLEAGSVKDFLSEELCTELLGSNDATLCLVIEVASDFVWARASDGVMMHEVAKVIELEGLVLEDLLNVSLVVKSQELLNYQSLI